MNPAALGCDDAQRWKAWVELESCRRIHAACFLLSVHGIWYYEQPFTSALSLDNLSPMMLSVPLSAGTQEAWDAETADCWARVDFAAMAPQTVADAMQAGLTPASVDSMPPFDVSLLLAAHALQLPRRQRPTEVEMLRDASCVKPDEMAIPTLFPSSPGGYTYLALHYTPLHLLLSVSGDSWVLNQKVPHQSIFLEHQATLQKWRRSGSAAAATVFAARALRIFLDLGGRAARRGDGPAAGRAGAACPWTDMSDFWAVYVCALICWAFGHEARCGAPRCSRGAAIGWLLTVAELEPGDLQRLAARDEARGVVELARDVLERDCLGGRNRLYADAVGVLRRLGEGDGWAWF